MKIDLEREQKLIYEHIAAGRRGDRAAQERAFSQATLAPHVLKAIKRKHGADYIRERGLNTAWADEEYGPDWLDKDD